MEWTRKHQNLTTVSDNAVFRSSVNKDEQDLPVKKREKKKKRRKKRKKEQRQRRLQLWVKASTESPTAASYQQMSVSKSRTNGS